MLDTSRTRVTVEPKQIAIYGKNIRRGWIGKLRATLKECLPPWTLLGTGIVGTSVPKVVTDLRLRNKLVEAVETMRVFGIKNIDVFSKGLEKGHTIGYGIEHATENHRAAVKHMSASFQNWRCEYASGWYTSKLEEAK